MGSKQIRKGSEVSWKWGKGSASGKVTEIYRSKIEKTIKGSTVSRDASYDCPAYLIEQNDGNKVLKSRSELKQG